MTFENIIQLTTYFKVETVCRQHLAGLRWGRVRPRATSAALLVLTVSKVASATSALLRSAPRSSA
jgi:hypothetical protein